MKTAEQLADKVQEWPKDTEIQWLVLDGSGNIISMSIAGDAMKTRNLLTAIDELKSDPSPSQR